MQYIGQTSNEMVNLMVTMFRDANGSEYDFMRNCNEKLESDERFKDVTHFELEIWYKTFHRLINHDFQGLITSEMLKNYLETGKFYLDRE